LNYQWLLSKPTMIFIIWLLFPISLNSKYIPISYIYSLLYWFIKISEYLSMDMNFFSKNLLISLVLRNSHIFQEDFIYYGDGDSSLEMIWLFLLFETLIFLEGYLDFYRSEYKSGSNNKGEIDHDWEIRSYQWDGSSWLWFIFKFYWILIFSLLIYNLYLPPDLK
jgi:hypothetical protein